MKKILNFKLLSLALSISLIAFAHNHASAMKKENTPNQNHTYSTISSFSFFDAPLTSYVSPIFNIDPSEIGRNLVRPSKPAYTPITHYFNRPLIISSIAQNVETVQDDVTDNPWLRVDDSFDDSSYPYSGVFTRHPLEIARSLPRPITPFPHNK